MATSKGQVWLIRHEDFGAAYVEAEAYDEATLKAAKVWKVPWRKVAATCWVERTFPIMKCVCLKCGRHFQRYGTGDVLCDMCKETEAENHRRREERRRAYYREVYGKFA